MKKGKHVILALVLALTFLMTDLAAAPATVYAAGKPFVSKSITLMKGNEIGYGVVNSVRSDKILKLKSSNTNVVTVKKAPFIDEWTILVNAKKAGSSTVTFKLKRKSGKVYTFKTKIRVYNYTNPVSKCSIGKTDYTKELNKKYMIALGEGNVQKGKINISMKKGYKLTGLYLCEHGTGKAKKIKNGSSVTLDSNYYVQVIYKNTSKKYSHALYLGI